MSRLWRERKDSPARCGKSAPSVPSLREVAMVLCAGPRRGGCAEGSLACSSDNGTAACSNGEGGHGFEPHSYCVDPQAHPQTQARSSRARHPRKRRCCRHISTQLKQVERLSLSQSNRVHRASCRSARARTGRLARKHMSSLNPDSAWFEPKAVPHFGTKSCRRPKQSCLRVALSSKMGTQRRSPGGAPAL